MRLVHKTQRFSEDLDFNVSDMKQGEFEQVLASIVHALKKEGLTINLDFRHWDNLLVADMIFPDIEAFYGINSKYSKKEGIVIKVESNQPKWKIKTETLLVSGFGQMFPVICNG